MRKTIISGLAVALLATSMPLLPATAAPAKQPAASVAHTQTLATDLSARRRHYRGGSRAGLAAFGLVAGTIGAIAAQQAYRDNYGYGYYGPAPYGYGYYGYGPRYYGPRW